MFHYILKRLLSVIPVLFGVSLIAFFSVRLIPGDFATIVLGTHYTEEAAAQLREQYGLNLPYVQQYLIWITNILQGDFGYSYMNNQPVIDLLLSRLPVTLELTVLSLAIAILIGIPMGYWAACRRNGLPDLAVTFFGLVGISVPNFWLGSMLVLVLSLGLGLFPSGGFVPLSQGLLANLQSVALPALALGGAVSAVVMRSARSAMVEVIDQEYIKTARAKGASGPRIVFCHAIRNTLVNVLTILGLQTGSLLGGSVVIEQIFSMPGVGALALDAISNREYLLMQGTILFVALMFVLINLVVDILYTVVNPQIRY